MNTLSYLLGLQESEKPQIYTDDRASRSELNGRLLVYSHASLISRVYSAGVLSLALGGNFLELKYRIYVFCIILGDYDNNKFFFEDEIRNSKHAGLLCV